MLIKKNVPYLCDDNIYILVRRFKIKKNHLYFFLRTEPYIDNYLFYWITDNNALLSPDNKLQPMSSIDEILYYDTIKLMKDSISSNYKKSLNMFEFFLYF